MKPRILLAIFFLFSYSVWAQAPDLQWVRSFNGVYGDDASSSIAVDGSGNVYTTGQFTGTVDFDPGSGDFTLTAAGQFDVFISKLNPSGNFEWAKRIGGNFYQGGLSILLDASGNMYVLGYFYGAVDFDPGPAEQMLTATDQDVFIMKLNPQGDLLWAKNVGGNGQDAGYSLLTDTLQNVCVAGFYSGTGDFDPGTGVFNLTAVGARDIFVLKLDSYGDFQWAISVGGAGDDFGRSLDSDASGNLYITGLFYGTVDFNPGAENSYLTSNGQNDAFILKLNEEGDFIWAKNIGGATNDGALSIAVDAIGNVYTAGGYSDIVDFDPGAQLAYQVPVGSNDSFILKLDSSGNFVWVRSLGGTANVNTYALNIDLYGNINATGSFHETADFDPGQEVFNLTSDGLSDIFILRIDPSGNFVWGQRIGGEGFDRGVDIKTDASGSIYITGDFSNTCDFDPRDGITNLTSAGFQDAFLLKLKASPTVDLREIYDQLDMQIFPNPSEGLVAISLTNITATYDLVLCDNTGRILIKTKASSPVNSIDMSGFQPGIYHLIITTQNNHISHSKLIRI